MTPILPALFWTIVILAAAVYATALICDWMRWDGPPSHNLDCLDKKRMGIIPADCPADHPTDWFVPAESETRP